MDKRKGLICHGAHGALICVHKHGATKAIYHLIWIRERPNGLCTAPEVTPLVLKERW